ncbi:hypothetical protein ITJ38_17995 [Agreia pratensis]|uniref:hypothetical protein n=1 Tax=Agreia pratensis TaxID=150121 RepID=UPI00188A50F6|nr:hypothetical protein [Agreia pratensis]MBF4636306.1 hypothetical protein [Agreia pratensis]
MSIVPEPTDSGAISLDHLHGSAPETAQASHTIYKWVLGGLIVAAVSLGMSLFLLVAQFAT